MENATDEQLAYQNEIAKQLNKTFTVFVSNSDYDFVGQSAKYSNLQFLLWYEPVTSILPPEEAAQMATKREQEREDRILDALMGRKYPYPTAPPTDSSGLTIDGAVIEERKRSDEWWITEIDGLYEPDPKDYVAILRKIGPKPTDCHGNSSSE